MPPQGSASPDGSAAPSRDSAEATAPITSLIARRAELLSRSNPLRNHHDDHGGGDAELAELTMAIEGLLACGHRVRYLEPAGSPHDAVLAGRLADDEPVNPSGSPAERERRFAADRRVILIEHPSLPDRPLNVLWVALCDGLPATLDQILDPQSPVIDPLAADTAVFYSIWNVEAGLSGLGRGKELVSGAMELLHGEFGQLETLTTLSPIPGLRRWVESRPDDGELTTSCARYLTTQGPDGRLLDPVARFHMGNGARLWRVLLDADTSSRGMKRSFGAMANYRYFPEDLEANKIALAEGSPALGQMVTEVLERT